MSRRSNERVVFHVVPNASGEEWVVSEENSNFRREFDKKEDAEEFAKSRAQHESLAQVKVHRRDGNMEYESTYGEDPRRYPS